MVVVKSGDNGSSDSGDRANGGTMKTQRTTLKAMKQ